MLKINITKKLCQMSITDLLSNLTKFILDEQTLYKLLSADNTYRSAKHTQITRL